MLNVSNMPFMLNVIMLSLVKLSVMGLQILDVKFLILGSFSIVSSVFTNTTFCFARNSEKDLVAKYWR
jgi:hypothetical protein